MIRFFLICIALFLSACSFKTPVNAWQHKSIAAFNSYRENFLSDRDSLATNDYNRALAHAKVSADLSTLARIYLGKCALNISVGIDDRCQEYTEIASLLSDTSLDAYYHLLNASITNSELEKLPNNYKTFAKELLNKEYEKANNAIIDMDKTSSKLLSAALLHKSINRDTLEYILEIASMHGYKKSVLFTLQRIKEISNNEQEKQETEKKISILKSEK